MVGRTSNIKRGRDTKIPQSSGPPVKVGDEAVHKELGDRMERAATTASSLEAEQDTDAQTRFEAASKQLNDPPLSRVNILGSGEDNTKLIELIAHCTTLSELASIRRHLKLEDSEGLKTLPTTESFEQLALMGVDIPLFPTMLTTPESSPSRITSSPSLSPQTYPSTSQPPSNQTTPITEEAALMPHESPL
ncbi:hypothetical protein Tco_0778026 [Tanacetum coccineum]